MKRKVLIVEDNPQNRYLMEVLLQSVGVQTLCAENGKIGVALAERELPDLILMDIQMPELDGFETTKLLKAQAKTQHIPVIAVSSYAMATSKKQAIEVGMAAYIEKPIQPERFLLQLEPFLQ